MKKIAIVGVEGSGKTVMMAAMGEQWERPDENGYFLSPESAEAFGFSKSVMAVLRSGRWPNASSHDEMRHLDWSLQRRQGGSREKNADVSMLDYAGEVYRQAFGGEKKEGCDEQVAALRSHVDEADVLIVLVNLSDILSGSLADPRTRDAMWLTKSVLDYALGEKRNRKPHTAIAFTQSDGYRQIIADNGGPAGTLRQYLPHVANLYDHLPVFAISAIDRTIVGDDGLPVPAPDFRSTGLQELMDWVITTCAKQETNASQSVETASARSVSSGKRTTEGLFWACFWTCLGWTIVGGGVGMSLGGILYLVVSIIESIIEIIAVRLFGFSPSPPSDESRAKTVVFVILPVFCCLVSLIMFLTYLEDVKRSIKRKRRKRIIETIEKLEKKLKN